MGGVTRSYTQGSTFGFPSGGARHGEKTQKCAFRGAAELQLGDADAQQGARDRHDKHVNKASPGQDALMSPSLRPL